MKTFAAIYTSDDAFVAGLLLAFGMTGMAVTLACYRASQALLALLLAAS
jgi:hypothetical protein